MTIGTPPAAAGGWTWIGNEVMVVNAAHDGNGGNNGKFTVDVTPAGVPLDATAVLLRVMTRIEGLTGGGSPALLHLSFGLPFALGGPSAADARPWVVHLADSAEAASFYSRAEIVVARIGVINDAPGYEYQLKTEFGTFVQVNQAVLAYQ